MSSRDARFAASPGKQRTKTQRAKEALKKAVANGTIKEVLWGKEIHSKNLKKLAFTSSPVVSPDDDPNMISLEEAALLNSVAIWNKVLVARIMKTARMIEKQKEDDILNSEKQIIIESDEENVSEADNDELDPTTAEGLDETHNKKKIKKKNKLKAKKRKQKNREKDIQTQEHDKPVDTPETTFEDSLQLGVKKQRRVSDIIKSMQANSRNARLNPTNGLARISENTDKQNNNSEESSTGTLAGENSDGTIDTSEDEDQFETGIAEKVHWGGANATGAGKRKMSSLGAATSVASSIKQAQKSKKQEYSLQVVEGLFNMSNELRVERESIVARGKDGSNNIEAFLNRETTLKYNEELDDVARSRSNEVNTQRKAALLRLKRAAVRYKVYKSTKVDQFEAFWDYVTKYNEQMDRHHAYADYAVNGSDNSEESDQMDQKQGDDEEEDSDKFISGGLESMFEENLGLLFATKQRAASELSTRMGSRGSSMQSLSSALTGPAGARNIRTSGSARFDGIDESGESGSASVTGEINQPPALDGSHMHSAVSSSVDLRGVGSQSGGVFANNNQRNLSSMIERMKAMGVYSEEKFRYTYGVKSKSDSPTNKAGSKRNEGDETGSDKAETPELRLEPVNLKSTVKDSDMLDDFNLSPMDRWLADSDDSNSFAHRSQLEDDDSSYFSAATHEEEEGSYQLDDSGAIVLRKKRKKRSKHRDVSADGTGKSPRGISVNPRNSDSNQVQAPTSIAEDSFVFSYTDSVIQEGDEMSRSNLFPFPVSSSIATAHQINREERKLKLKQERREQRKQREQELAKADAWLNQQLREFAKVKRTRGEKPTHNNKEGTTEDTQEMLLHDPAKTATQREKEEEGMAEEKQDATFLTDFLHYININPFEDQPQGENRAIYELLSMKTPHQTILDPSHLLPQDRVAFHRPNASLKGKWQYDQSIPSLLIPRVYRQIRRAVVKQLKKGDRAKAKRSQYTDRKRYNIHYRRNIYKELVFDPETRNLILRTCEDHNILHSICIHVNEVYLTDAAYQDMVTVRTTSTSVVPSGYVGTFPALQWRNIEEEINASMLLQHLAESKDLLESICDDDEDNLDGSESLLAGETPSVNDFSTSPSKTIIQNKRLLPFQKLEQLRQDTQIVFHKFPSVQEGPGRDHIVPGLEVHPPDVMVYRKADAKVAKRKAALLAMENELDHGPTEEELFPLQTMIPKLTDVLAHPANQHFVRAHVHALQEEYERNALEVDGKFEENSIKKILTREIAKKEEAERVAQHAAMTRVFSTDRLRQRLAVDKDLANVDQQRGMGYEAVGHVACGDNVSFSLVGIPAGKETHALLSPVNTTPTAVPPPAKPSQPKKNPSFRTKKLVQSQSTLTPHPPLTSPRLKKVMDDSTFGSAYVEVSPLEKPKKTIDASMLPLPHVPPKQPTHLDLGAAHLLPGASTVYQQYLSPFVPGLEKEVQETLSMTSSIATQSIISHPYASLLPHPTSTPGTALSTPFYLPALVRWPASGTGTAMSGYDGRYLSGTPNIVTLPTTRSGSASSGSSADSSVYEGDFSGLYQITGFHKLSPTLAASEEEEAKRLAQAAAVLDSAQIVTTHVSGGSAGSSSNIVGDKKMGIEEPSSAVEDIDQLPFSYAFQIIMLIETRRIMQLYFTKKFLQMDIAVNVHLTFYDATESLMAAPDLHGLIFISYLDLVAAGVKKSLDELIPPELDKKKYTIIVYDVAMGEEEDNLEELSLLEECGVTDIMYPPYTVTALKDVLEKHKRKQELRREFR